MTPAEMRLAAAEWEKTEDKSITTGHAIHKLYSHLWLIGSQFCERLDDVRCELQIHNETQGDLLTEINRNLTLMNKHLEKLAASNEAETLSAESRAKKFKENPRGDLPEGKKR